MCESDYSHTGGGIDTVDLFLIFKIICYTLAFVGVPIEKEPHWVPPAPIALDSRLRLDIIIKPNQPNPPTPPHLHKLPKVAIWETSNR